MSLCLLLLQAARSESYPRVHVDFALTSPDPFIESSPAINWRDIAPEEEIRSAVVPFVEISYLFNCNLYFYFVQHVCLNANHHN